MSYIEINDLGSFANINALWAAYPEGGQEGDYCTIDGVKYRWDKYDRMWVADPNFGPTPARKVDTFYGDVNMQNNLTVAGYIRAKGIKQPCLGLFLTYAALTARWPEPEVGSWALVGDDLPAELYVYDATDGWKDTGNTVSIDEIEFDVDKAIAGWVPISSTDQLPANPTAEQQARGYLLGTTLYVYDSEHEVYVSAQLKGDKGDKGDQGNSGYSGAAGELEVVNNLEDGGETSALSAEMGKELGEQVDTLNGLTKYKQNSNDTSGKYIYTNGSIFDSSGWSVSREISLSAGDTVNVTVSSTNGNSIVIGRVKNASSVYTADAVLPATGQTVYSYTASADCSVKITYPTSGGFSAEVDSGNPTAKVDAKVENILSRLGGTVIPFDQPKTYKYENNALVEVTGSLTTGCSTAKLNIADYKALFYSGCRSTYNGYFCAVFFDDNDNYVGWGLRPHDEKSDTSLVTHTVTYDMVNVLAEVPSGATKVVLQTDKDVAAAATHSVIAFSEFPYNFLQEEDWRQSYYGVVGDGVTDDTTALQALLDNSRGEVSLRAGSYLITSPLVVNATKLRRIKGNGATLKVSGDIVAFDVYGNTTDDVTPDVEGDWRINHAGFTLEGMRITAINGSQGTGISLTGCLKPTIKNCYIWHIKDGIVMHLNRDVIIEGCNIYQCTGSGVLFASDSSVHQANINGNHISWCRNCILFDSALQINNIQFTGNDIEVGNSYPSIGDNCCIRMTNNNPTLVGEVEFVGNTIQGHTGSSSIINISGDPLKPLKPAYGMSFIGNFMSGCANNYFELAYIQNITIANNIIKGVTNSFINLSGTIELLSVVGNVMNTLETIGKKLLTTANDAVLNNISVNDNIGNPASITISGASQDYISVVGNNLGGGTVTIGTAPHKQEANNI